jgi:hypothetical protein
MNPIFDADKGTSDAAFAATNLPELESLINSGLE